MSVATAPTTSGRVAARSQRLVTTVVAIVGMFVLWVLLNAVIGGRCDLDCVVGTAAQTLRLATPIAFAALCGVMCERSGVVDIGIEGKMLMSAMVCYGVNLFSYQVLKDVYGPDTAGTISRVLALVAGMISALMLSILHSVVSIRFKTDQIISGTVINMLAIGITGFMYRAFLAENLPAGPGTFPSDRDSRAVADPGDRADPV